MERINPEQIGGIFGNQSIRQRDTFLKIAMQRIVFVAVLTTLFTSGSKNNK